MCENEAFSYCFLHHFQGRRMLIEVLILIQEHFLSCLWPVDNQTDLFTKDYACHLRERAIICFINLINQINDWMVATDRA